MRLRTKAHGKSKGTSRLWGDRLRDQKPIPPIAGEDEGRNRRSQQVNTWLQAWCHRQNLEFFDHGSVYMAPGLLATEGVHLSQKGTRILAQESAGLIDRALN